MSDFVPKVVGELPPARGGKPAEKVALYELLRANRGKWVLIAESPRKGESKITVNHFATLKRRGAKLAERCDSKTWRVYAMLPPEAE